MQCCASPVLIGFVAHLQFKSKTESSTYQTGEQKLEILCCASVFLESANLNKKGMDQEEKKYLDFSPFKS